MLTALITSKTRLKLLFKFFLNTEIYSYLNELASEFNESTNSVRVELNRLSNAKLLICKSNGKKIFYSANKMHPLFPEIHNLIKKSLGLYDLEEIIDKIGNIKKAYLTGDLAQGRESGIIDLILVGIIDKNLLNNVIFETENKLKKKIRVLVVNSEEIEIYKNNLKIEKSLLFWSQTNNSLV